MAHAQPSRRQSGRGRAAEGKGGMPDRAAQGSSTRPIDPPLHYTRRAGNDEIASTMNADTRGRHVGLPLQVVKHFLCVLCALCGKMD